MIWRKLFFFFGLKNVDRRSNIFRQEIEVEVFITTIFYVFPPKKIVAPFPPNFLSTLKTLIYNGTNGLEKLVTDFVTSVTEFVT
jgi:hypothetical protein